MTLAGGWAASTALQRYGLLGGGPAVLGIMRVGAGEVERGGLTLLPAGPAYLRNLVSHLAVISAQKARDLLDREAPNKHVA